VLTKYVILTRRKIELYIQDVDKDGEVEDSRYPSTNKDCKYESSFSIAECSSDV